MLPQVDHNFWHPSGREARKKHQILNTFHFEEFLDQNWTFFQNLMCSINTDELIPRLACLFKRQFQTFARVMIYMLEHEPKFKSSLLSLCMNSESVARTLTTLNVHLRYQEDVSTWRWRRSLYPFWQSVVRIHVWLSDHPS